MRLVIDGILYEANLRNVANHLASFYIENSKKMQEIDIGGGKKIDFGKKSLIRTAMKVAMVGLVVPVVSLLYRLRGLPPPKHEKHEDLIDWMVVKMIEFGGIIEGDIQLNAYSKEIEDGDGSHRRIIESISTIGTNIFNKGSVISVIGTGEVIRQENVGGEAITDRRDAESS